MFNYTERSIWRLGINHALGHTVEFIRDDLYQSAEWRIVLSKIVHMMLNKRADLLTSPP